MKKDYERSPGGILAKVMAEHGSADDPDPIFLQIGGKYVATPTAHADGDAAVLWVDPQGYARPHRETVILGSLTTATGSGTATAITRLSPFRDTDVLVLVSAASGTSPTLDVYLDTRLEASSTLWTNLAHVTQFTATGTFALHLSRRQSAGQVDVGADAGAGTVRPIGWADDLRLRYNIAGTTPSFTFKVTGNFI